MAIGRCARAPTAGQPIRPPAPACGDASSSIARDRGQVAGSLSLLRLASAARRPSRGACTRRRSSARSSRSRRRGACTGRTAFSFSALTKMKKRWPSSSIRARASSSNMGSMANRFVLTMRDSGAPPTRPGPVRAPRRPVGAMRRGLPHPGGPCPAASRGRRPPGARSGR